MAEALIISIRGRHNLIAEVVRTHGYESLKEEQLLATEEFILGRDVFVLLLLRTGFGKSLIDGLPIPSRSITPGQLIASHSSFNSWNVYNTHATVAIITVECT